MSEAAALLGVDTSVIRKRLRAGTMKGEHVHDRLWMVSDREVARWQKMGKLRAGRKPKPTPPEAVDV